MASSLVGVDRGHWHSCGPIEASFWFSALPLTGRSVGKGVGKPPGGGVSATVVGKASSLRASAEVFVPATVEPSMQQGVGYVGAAVAVGEESAGAPTVVLDEASLLFQLASDDVVVSETVGVDGASVVGDLAVESRLEEMNSSDDELNQASKRPVRRVGEASSSSSTTLSADTVGVGVGATVVGDDVVVVAETVGSGTGTPVVGDLSGRWSVLLDEIATCLARGDIHAHRRILAGVDIRAAPPIYRRAFSALEEAFPP